MKTLYANMADELDTARYSEADIARIKPPLSLGGQRQGGALRMVEHLHLPDRRAAASGVREENAHFTSLNRVEGTHPRLSDRRTSTGN